MKSAKVTQGFFFPKHDFALGVYSNCLVSSPVVGVGNQLSTVFHFSNAGSRLYNHRLVGTLGSLSSAAKMCITVLLSNVAHISKLLFQELEWWLKWKGKLAGYVNSNHGDRAERKVNHKSRLYHFCQRSVNSQHAQKKEELSYGWENQTAPILRRLNNQPQGGGDSNWMHTSPGAENSNLLVWT